MSEKKTGSEQNRLAHPFPSRREVHGSRIPSTTKTGTIPIVDDQETGEKVPVDAVETETSQGWHPVRTQDEGNKKQETDATPAPAKSDPTKDPSTPKKPVAPKAEFPYPSRKTIHQTGAIPISSPEAAEELGIDVNGRPVRRGPVTSSGGHAVARPAVRAPRQAPTKKRGPSRLRTTLVLVLTLIFVGGAAYFAYTALTPPSTQEEEALDYPGPGEGTAEVTIAPGEIGTDIGQKLVDAGVVKTVEGFRRVFDANSAAATIKPGTYTLRKGMTSAAALALLLDEENRVDNALTVNPGQTAEQIIEKLVSVGGFTQDEVDASLADPKAFGLPEEADGNVEGWLAAGSYEVSSDSTPEDLLSEMVSRTVKELERLDIPDDQWETTLTKASILEREVANEEDMGRVARVIENRLSDKEGETAGLLQMDSTVLYGVDKYGGIPTTKDLESGSPYNTYMKPGLPPGPIATPSVEAIEATTNPEEGNWLYFVTVNLDTGETKFASTMDEQEKNTQLLKDWCEANPGRC